MQLTFDLEIWRKCENCGIAEISPNNNLTKKYCCRCKPTGLNCYADCCRYKQPKIKPRNGQSKFIECQFGHKFLNTRYDCPECLKKQTRPIKKFM